MRTVCWRGSWYNVIHVRRRKVGSRTLWTIYRNGTHLKFRYLTGFVMRCDAEAVAAQLEHD